MKKMTPIQILTLLLAILVGAVQLGAQTIIAGDNFDLVDGRTINSQLDGKTVQTGTGTWAAGGNIRFQAFDSETVVYQYGTTPQRAILPFSYDSGDDFTLTWDVSRESATWLAGGIHSGDKDDAIYNNGLVWMNFNGSVVKAFKNGTSTQIGSYTAGVDFYLTSGGEFQTMSLSYDSSANTVTGSINGKILFSDYLLDSPIPTSGNLILEWNSPADNIGDCFKNIQLLSVLPILYPDDANIVNAATHSSDPAYRAIPNDGIDDTDAINYLLSKFNGQSDGSIHDLSSRILYLPAGIYNISGTLGAKMKDDYNANEQTACSVTIAGAGESLTKLVLTDGSLASSGDNFAPIPVIKQGKKYRDEGPAQSGPGAAYGNLVRDLSIDLGNNANAAGILVNMANMGSISDVTITATNAAVGLLTYDRCGTGLIRNVTIEGCNYGIRQFWEDRQIYNNDPDDIYQHVYMDFPGAEILDGLVFENIKISDYKVSGIHNYGKHYVMRNVEISTAQASGPAIELGFSGHPAQLEIYNLSIDGATGQSGIQSTHPNNFILLRDAKFPNRTANCTAKCTESCEENCTENCAKSIYFNNEIYETITCFSEYTSPPMLSRNMIGRESTLRLPVRDAPKISPSLSQWAKSNVHVDNSGEANRIALQADINTCDKEVLYIPYGKYDISGVMTIDNPNLKMIKGFFSYITGGVEFYCEQANEFLIFEDIVIAPNSKITHKMKEDLVLRNIGVGPYIQNTSLGTGDIFLENLGAKPKVSVSGGINVFIRQINREKEGFVNDGAVVWCLGDNIEDVPSTGINPWVTKNGGYSEILGAQFDAHTAGAVAENAENYLYEIEGARSRFALVGSGMYIKTASDGWDLLLKDDTSSQYESQFVQRGDYPVADGGNSLYGRMLMPPYVIDRRALAYYPMDTGGVSSNASQVSHHLDLGSSASELVSKETFGFIGKQLIKNTDDVDPINGVSKHVNAQYLANTGSYDKDDLLGFDMDYCEFSVSPVAGYKLDIEGISFDYAGSNAATDDFLMQFYIVDATDATAPVILGSTPEMSVAKKKNNINGVTWWEKHWIDLSDIEKFRQFQQQFTEQKVFRLYFTANKNTWHYEGYFDNLTVHGQSRKQLVAYNFDTSLAPTNQDSEVQGLSGWNSNLIHVGDLGLAIEGSAARVLSQNTPDSILEAKENNRYLQFAIKPSSDKKVSLRMLSFDCTTIAFGTNGPLNVEIVVEASTSGQGKFKTLGSFSHVFQEVDEPVGIELDLDFPLYTDVTDETVFRIYIADDQNLNSYRWGLDNLTVYGDVD